MISPSVFREASTSAGYFLGLTSGSINDWPCQQVAMNGARSAKTASFERGS